MNVFDLVATLSLDSSNFQKGLSKASSAASKIGSGVKKAAKVGAVAIGTLTASTTALSGAFAKGISQTAKYGDHIDKVSQKMGISAKAYQEWDAVLQHSGSSIDALKASMKSMANATRSDSGVMAFQELGITLKELDSLSQEELFAKTIESLQKVEDTTTRTYLAGKTLGRGANELGALLNTSAEDTQKMKDRVNELGGVLSDEAVKASAKFQDSLQDMKTALSGIKNTLMSEFLPGATTVMDGLTEIFVGNTEEGTEKIEKGVNTLSETLIQKAPTFANIGTSLFSALFSTLGEVISTTAPIFAKQIPTLIKSIVPSLIETAKNIFTTVLNSLVQNTSEVVNFVKDLSALIINSAIEILPDIVSLVLDLAIQLMQSLTEMLPELIPQLIDLVMKIADLLVQNLSPLIEAALEMAVALVKGLTSEESITKLIDGITSVIDSLVKMITEDDMLAKFIKAGVTMITSIVSAIPTIVVKIAEKLPDLIIGIVSALTDPETLKALIEAGPAVFLALVQKLPEAIIELAKHMPEIIEGIVEALKKGLENIAEVGKGIIEGIWEGIKNAADWLWDKISGFAEDMLDNIKDAFGIGLPSKLMRDKVGKFLAQGIGVGFVGEMPEVIKSMEEALPTSLESNIDYSFSGSADAFQMSENKEAFGKTTYNQNFEVVINNPTIREDSDIDNLVDRINTELGQMFLTREVAFG